MSHLRALSRPWWEGLAPPPCGDFMDAPAFTGTFRLWRYLMSKRRHLNHPRHGKYPGERCSNVTSDRLRQLNACF